MPAMKLGSRLKQVEKLLCEAVEDRASIPRFVSAEEAEELRAQGKFVKTVYLPEGGPGSQSWADGFPITSPA